MHVNYMNTSTSSLLRPPLCIRKGKDNSIKSNQLTNARLHTHPFPPPFFFTPQPNRSTHQRTPIPPPPFFHQSQAVGRHQPVVVLNHMFDPEPLEFSVFTTAYHLDICKLKRPKVGEM